MVKGMGGRGNVEQRWKERDKITVVPGTGKQMNGASRNGRPENCWYQEREASSTFLQTLVVCRTRGLHISTTDREVLFERVEFFTWQNFILVIFREIVSSFTAKKVFSQL